MRIFVVEPRGSGGMIHYAYQLCNALSLHATEVTLVTAKRYELDGYPNQFKLCKLFNLWRRNDRLSGTSTHNRIRKVAWTVYRNIRRIFRGMRFFLEWVKLSRYLLRERPDIIQFGEIEFPFEALFLQYLKSRGLILTQICHEFEPRERADSPLVIINNRLLKNVFRSFTVIFFHSQSNIDRFRELYPEIPEDRSHIIAMGNGQIFPTDGAQERIKNTLMARYSIGKGEKIVLFFGNITPSKGIPDLITAFAKVYPNYGEVRLLIAGMPLKYIDEDTLIALASKLGIRSATIFDMRYLPMEEVGPLIDLATVVVFPYVSSTQSASIQAAYAFGKPVIATRVGGLPDIVDEGKSGFLVEPHSPDQLASAIMRIIDDPNLAEQMGCYAKQLSETRFAWGPIAGDIVSVYQNILIERQ